MGNRYVSQEIDKQAPRSNLRRGNPAWVKGGPSPNPAGRKPKEHTLRDCLQQIGEQRAKGLTEKEKAALKRLGYRSDWTYEQVLCGKLWARALNDDEFGITKVLDYRIGRPVPLTDMPTIVVNQQTVVEQHQESSIDKAVGAFKALVEAGIVPAEMFRQYIVTSGNGHDNDSDR